MGKIHTTIGGQPPIFYDFNGKKYELIDGLPELFDYIGFKAIGSWFPTDHWEMTIIINFGAMGSGKSTYDRGICELGYNIYHDTRFGFECYQTNDLIATMNHLNKEERIWHRKKVLFLVFDDAMGTKAKGMNSLNTMGKNNKEFEELLSELRHKLANEDENGNPDPRVLNGFCCCIFSIQSLKRLSTMVRDNSTLRIFKTAYDELRSMFNEEDFEFLKGITEDSDKHIYASRGYALAKSKNSTMKFFFPNSHFKIPVLIPDNDDLQKYAELIDAAYEKYDPEMGAEEFAAYVWKWGKNHGYDLSPSGIREIKYEVLNRYYFKSNSGSAAKTEIIEQKQQTNFELIDKLRGKGMTYDDIADSLGSTKGKIYGPYQEWLKQQKLKAKLEQIQQFTMS